MGMVSGKSENPAPAAPSGAALRLLYRNLADSPIIRVTPGGQHLLTALDATADAIEAQDARIAALEGATAEKQARDEKLTKMAERMIEMAERLGQIGTPIADPARPGGPLPGDLPAALMPGDVPAGA